MRKNVKGVRHRQAVIFEGLGPGAEDVRHFPRKKSLSRLVPKFLRARMLALESEEGPERRGKASASQRQLVDPLSL